MDDEDFIDKQRRRFDIGITIFFIVIGLMWLATLCDYLFGMGWGWDVQILWLGPAMVAWGVIVRVCGRAIFKFIGSNF